MKKVVLALTIAVMFSGQVMAANKFWDRNGTTAGSGANGTTAALTASTWATNTGGTSASTTAVNGDLLIFAAGTDATLAYTATGSLTTSAAGGGLTVQEGILVLDGTVTLGANPVIVEAGAILSTNSSLRISTTAGQTYTLNNGTLRTTNPAAAGSFVDVDSDIILNGGGTFDQSVVNILNIVQTATSITGTGPLTKTGVGVLAIASTAGTNTYSGGTIINDGELRMRTVVNTLPVTTDVTVTSPGIFNLNGVNTQIGSLTGNGNVGTGSGTLTIDGATSTTFNGAVLNLANAGAAAVASGNGRIIKNGASTITFTGVNDINGSVTLNAGGITVNLGGSLCGDIADLTVNGGTLTLKQAAEKVENLAGTGGSIVLDNASLQLITDPVASTSYAGTISGTGGLRKDNVLSGATQRTLTLSGPNSYDGVTTVSGGIISVQNATALGSTTGDTQVLSGGEVLFTGAGGSVSTSENFRIVGTGSTDNGAIAVIASANPLLSGTMTLTGNATVTVSTPSAATFSGATAFSGTTETLTLAGGTTAGGVVSGLISLGTGGLTKTNGGKWTLSNAAGNTYSGNTSITAGTLVASNTTGSATGSGNVNITNGTLAGHGSVSGDVTITGTGSISPGESIGSLGAGALSFGATSSYTYEIKSDNPLLTMADLLDSTGSLSITAGAAMNVSDLATAVIALGTKLTAIAYNGTWDGGTFAGKPNFGTFVVGANQFRIRYADLNPGGNFLPETAGATAFVTLTAVPELSSFLAFGLTGLIAAAAVRFGRRFGFAALKL